MIKIGEKIPDFTFSAFHGEKDKKIKFSSYKGKWLVLIFYPADFTFVCPTELEEAANYYKEFQKLGAEVFSITPDTVFVHKAWPARPPAIKKIKFPMVADSTGNICRAFGTYIETEGLSLRGRFFFVPNGNVPAHHTHHN